MHFVTHVIIVRTHGVGMGNLRNVIKDLNLKDFGEFLLEKRVHEEVASLFVSNRISGSVFKKLLESDLNELIPTIGN